MRTTSKVKATLSLAPLLWTLALFPETPCAVSVSSGNSRHRDLKNPGVRSGAALFKGGGWGSQKLSKWKASAPLLFMDIGPPPVSCVGGSRRSKAPGRVRETGRFSSADVGGLTRRWVVPPEAVESVRTSAEVLQEQSVAGGTDQWAEFVSDLQGKIAINLGTVAVNIVLNELRRRYLNPILFKAASKVGQQLKPRLTVESWLKLAACVVLDAVGDVSEIFAFVGEATDILWAPAEFFLLKKLFGSNLVAGIGFLKEILPFTDIIPMFTISWLLQEVWPSTPLAERLGLGLRREVGEGELVEETEFLSSQNGTVTGLERLRVRGGQGEGERVQQQGRGPVVVEELLLNSQKGEMEGEKETPAALAKARERGSLRLEELKRDVSAEAWGLLAVCVFLDLIGEASSVLPFGEASDIVWAPVQGLLLRYMFQSDAVAFIGFVEELLPSTDAMPTFTLAWCLREFWPDTPINKVLKVKGRNVFFSSSNTETDEKSVNNTPFEEEGLLKFPKNEDVK
uniref:Uncharacterized protein n=2 Tax=Chromera velia CCMP2878 TaxID=1169474 RepID=A0A0K6S7U8_9ALVE|eukprot:Cvel_23159.t2-p1 / transcript=Cvel_23159.t2 / gene=Cvel_23159 / organism=Chromera_velia_CCMP2878 / gene_product=hypothetical protein / transcript_product=hypothetical protein / location=Cvel_scaffold2356:9197-12078(-) / protein_length=511 / sequence_SO=supercontig / SO=protein_coding / is_pseudo=false